MHHLVYLHGFLSSPQSLKAKQTLAYASTHFPSVNVHVPTLPGNIQKAVHLIDNLVATLPMGRTHFIGSSMGGFLSSYALEKYFMGCNNACAVEGDYGPKAVLVNPAVEPFNLLGNYMGKHINPYTNEQFYVWDQHIQTLRQLYVNKLHNPAQYKILLQKGDETLDYVLAANKYAGANMHIEEGGNHSFVNYAAHLPRIFAFLYSPT